ncbi:MAG: acetyl-CoA carboxylase biotin carboxyl carrier protein [Merismopediaceae bacterium]|nr:acetyl-CoA carboxylase biotin carboxyl carrier protein [Merismopediaceae bacterium]
MSINFSELRELLAEISQTGITELTLKTEAFELSIRQGTTITPEVLGMSPLPPALVTMPGGNFPAATPMVTAPPTIAPAFPPETPSEPATPPGPDPKWTAIASPMVGTFYRAPAPDEPPFTEVGEMVRKGQTVCIIEAMKLMNEIEAEISGKIMKLEVDNGQPVEFGQTLMWVDTAG